MKSVPVGLRSPGTLEFSVIVRWPKPKMLVLGLSNGSFHSSFISSSQVVAAYELSVSVA